VALDRGHDVVARDVGQHEVDQAEVGFVALGHHDAVLAPGRELRLDAGVALQLQLHDVGEVDLVVDDEDAALAQSRGEGDVAGAAHVEVELRVSEVVLPGVLEELGLEESVLDGAAEFVLGDAGEAGGFGERVDLLRLSMGGSPGS
jgi:hypothetical protein